MAAFTALQPVNLLSGSFFLGTLNHAIIPSTTVIQLVLGNDRYFLDGAFDLEAEVVESGTITGFRHVLPTGTTEFTGSGFNLDLNSEYLVLNFGGADGSPDSFGLVTALFRGDDLVTGSTGNDTLVGMDGNDTVTGAAGDDEVNGNTGDDSVRGGGGRDFARGGQGNDTVLGDLGDDWHVNGNIGDDLVYGGLGNDTVYGGQGNDTLIGDDADGSGQGGNDFLSGDLGDDLLFGDFGNDTLAGGAGADRFFFFSAEGDDVILDFSGAEGDRIQIEAGINGTGVDTFAEVQARISADGQGGSVIDLGAGNSVIVQGVAPGAFTQDMFGFFNL